MKVVAMSRRAFEALPERPRAEWAEGKAYIMMAPVAFEHGHSTVKLIALLVNCLTGVDVVTEVGYRMADSDRGPDIAVVPAGTASGTWITEPPLLIVEIVSPSTRSQDYVTKSAEYGKAGVGQYWIVDPQVRVVTILVNDGKGGWDLAQELNPDNPTATIEIPNHGIVNLALDAIV